MAAAQERAPQVQAPVRIISSPQLFAVMAALDASGFESEARTLDIYPAHAKLRGELLELQGPAAAAVRQFYKAHALLDPGETLSRFVSFALVIGSPPKFPYLVSPDQIPPDALPVAGFNEILSNFYQEAHLDRQYAVVASETEAGIRGLEEPVRQIVFSASNYLREITRPSYGRTFEVLVEPLVGDRIYFRNFGEQYAIVVGPGPRLPVGDIRHAYLHFLLDPFPLQYRDLIETRRDLLNYAARAPQLPVAYQQDFVGFFDECLVRAVELRLRRLAPDREEETLAQNDRSGFVLVRPLVEQLKKFEKSQPAMSYYFPELVNGISLRAEEQRESRLQFAPVRAAALPTRDEEHAEDAAELDRLFTKGDREIAMQDGPAAAATFDSILAKYPRLPRAVYGLAVASVLEGQADRAKELFTELVNPSAKSSESPRSAAAGPEILAWSHVYLGRIHDLEGERKTAIEEYRAAIAVDGAPEAARVAAQRGLNSAYQAPSRHAGGKSPQL